MCAVAAIAVLLSLLLVTPWAWIPIRALSGFCFAGAAMIVESWLNERANAASRGRIFGVYTMINLLATTAGQMVLTLGDTTGFFFFVLAAIVYCLALLPTAVSATLTPSPLTVVPLNLGALWRNSPVAVFSVFMVGISNAAFGTLAAVYAARIGLKLDDIAFFASIPILAGAVAQLPVGYASDRMDRRLVVVAIALGALVMDMLFLFGGFSDPTAVLILAGLFGATVYGLYPVIVAHANDHAAQGTFVQISSGLLLIYGLGSIIGPSAAGLAMTEFGDGGLFIVTAAAHGLIVAFAATRLVFAPTVATEDKTPFQPIPHAHGSTPETAALAADAGELSAHRAKTMR